VPASQPAQLIHAIQSATSNEFLFSRPLSHPATCPAPNQCDSITSSLHPLPDQMHLRCSGLALPATPTGTRALPLPSDLAHATPSCRSCPAATVYWSRWPPWGLPLEVGERPTCESSRVPVRSCLRRTRSTGQTLDKRWMHVIIT
jgi:hypothetical protein